MTIDVNDILSGGNASLAVLERYIIEHGIDGSESDGADPADIAALPIRFIEKGESETECAICQLALRPEDEVTVLPSSPLHFFHSLCIGGWLRMHRSCVLCRRSITDEGPGD